MAVIFIHHITQICAIPFCHFSSIIKSRLVDIPAVHIFVHHQHSQPVACLKQIFRSRIVRAANGVVAVFHQNPYSPLFGFRISFRAQQLIVRMNAAALQKQPFSIHLHTVLCVPGKLADAKGHLTGVIRKPCAAPVKLRAPRIPESCPVD